MNLDAPHADTAKQTNSASHWPGVVLVGGECAAVQFGTWPSTDGHDGRATVGENCHRRRVNEFSRYKRQPMIDKIRNTLHQYAHLNRDVFTISEDADLYAYGLTSHATVNLMLGLEDTFQVEFPERMLRRRTFETIANIHESIVELTAGQPTAAS
ncbi:MAG: acyl carrier protein [Gemmatimonadota bacterium]